MPKFESETLTITNIT